ncbi:MAG TPA: hypothetical protein DC064_04280, partial [Cyanobacteria bacterium UBA9273]|nr:hypothetical protein [Cyanobacteria bacterium UBA9273]
WLLVVCCLLFVVCCLLGKNNQSGLTNFVPRLPAVHLLNFEGEKILLLPDWVGSWAFTLVCPTTNNKQPTINNQPPTTNHQPPTTKNQQLKTNNQQPTTNNQQLTTNNQQLTTNN